jgi:F-type H+-transporting ATPase subunit epsilon
MSQLKVNIITPEGEVENSDYYMAVICAKEGELGIMENHAPLLTLLKEGDINLYESEGKIAKTIKITGGFAEVSNNECNILADKIASE